MINLLSFLLLFCRNPLSRKGHIDFFGEHEGAWIRKYVVIRRPYILIYNTEKDMVRGREGGRKGEGWEWEGRLRGGERRGRGREER